MSFFERLAKNIQTFSYVFYYIIYSPQTSFKFPDGRGQKNWVGACQVSEGGTAQKKKKKPTNGFICQSVDKGGAIPINAALFSNTIGWYPGGGDSVLEWGKHRPARSAGKFWKCYDCNLNLCVGKIQQSLKRMGKFLFQSIKRLLKKKTVPKFGIGFSHKNFQRQNNVWFIWF
jgi:hypothetical protein